MRHSAVIAAIGIVYLGAAHGSASAEEPTLLDVLARAGAYVAEFQRQLSGIVAEEHYIQDARPGVQQSLRMTIPSVSHRELKSDLLLVRPDGTDRWIQFRDVFEVDGRLVRDRDERLMKLFVAPSKSTAAQVEHIADESSRFNIGNLLRTVNVPVLALSVLELRNQSRFTFSRGTRARPPLGRDTVPLADDAWVVEFAETAARTIIRTANGRDLPVRGRFWLDPTTGRVLASGLIAEDVALKGTIDVQYQLEPALGLLVPTDMRERYEIRRDGSRVEGVATYSHFRQFQVKVDEKIAPIK